MSRGDTSDPAGTPEQRSDLPKGQWGQGGQTSRSRTEWTAAELMAVEFPPARWAVPGVVPDGCTLLSGQPKIGKSWLALGLAVAVASGCPALGRLDVGAASPVLYLALEDTGPRLQDRLRTVLAGEPAPGDLTLWTECPPLAVGGEALIGQWLADHTDARLVVVDVLARVRRPVAVHGSAYEADYRAITDLKRLGDEYGVAVVVVHHTRQAGADDWMDTVSGTNGLVGAADTVMVLRRARGDADAGLHLTGRDIADAEHALRFAGGTWTLLDGPALEHLVAETRATILADLRQQPGRGPSSVADTTGLPAELTKKTMQRMATDGQLTRDRRGRYTVPDSDVPPVPPVPSAGQDGSGVSPELSPPPELSPLRGGRQTTDDKPASIEQRALQLVGDQLGAVPLSTRLPPRRRTPTRLAERRLHTPPSAPASSTARLRTAARAAGRASSRTRTASRPASSAQPCRRTHDGRGAAVPRDRTGEPIDERDVDGHGCVRGWLPGHTPHDDDPRPCLRCRPWLRERRPPTRDELDDFRREASR